MGSPVRHRSRPFAALTLALASPALLGVAPAAEGVAVTVAIRDLRSAKGLVRACMARLQADFPDCPPAAHAHRVSVSAAGTVELRFADIAPGRYAIALLHDENANGKVDKVLGLMPKEGFGFSRDAAIKMGPPSFDAAAFEVGDRPLKLSIRMRYLL
jgi:uncharacterized protein (DUF2141 family)